MLNACRLNSAAVQRCIALLRTPGGGPVHSVEAGAGDGRRAGELRQVPVLPLLPARAALHGRGPVQLLLRYLQVGQSLTVYSVRVHCYSVLLSSARERRIHFTSSRSGLGSWASSTSTSTTVSESALTTFQCRFWYRSTPWLNVYTVCFLVQGFPFLRLLISSNHITV